jgi:hypothetical protein
VLDAGELILRRGTIQTGELELSTNCGYIMFGPNGTPRRALARCFPVTDAPASTWAFLLCDDRGRDIAAGGLTAARLVRIDRFGRAQVLQELAGLDGTGINDTITGTLGAVGPNCPL